MRPIIQPKTAIAIAEGWRGPQDGPVDRFILCDGKIEDEDHRLALHNAIAECMDRASASQFQRLKKLVSYINNAEMVEDVDPGAPGFGF